MDGWMKSAFIWEKLKKKTDGYWSKDRCRQEALKFKARKQFQNNAGGGFEASRRNGWMDEVCSHMQGVVVKITKAKVTKPKVYLTKENCQEDALKYKRRIDFKRNSRGLYQACCRNQWLDEVCFHMEEITKKPHDYWSKERCQEEALKYTARRKFWQSSGSAYQASRMNRWLDEVCSHMKEIKRSMKEIKRSKWSKENCQEEALKYKTRTKFAESSGSAYRACKRNGWFDEVCFHMKVGPKWSKDDCQKEALKYKARTKFAESSGGAYCACKKNGWLDEVCSHM